MTPKEASVIIGCSVRHVRTMIAKGNLEATRIITPDWGCGWIWDINPKEVHRVSNKIQRGGWPRGVSRKGITNG